MHSQPTTVAPNRGFSSRFGSFATKLFVLLLLTALTIILTYPLILDLESAIPGPPWDNFVWLYDLYWLRHSVVELGEWPLFNNTIFAPFGYDLTLSETILANKALIAPVLFWGDEVLAYNALLLISFVLTGYATYLLVSYLTDNPYAAVIAGVAFAFCPYRIHSMAAGWLPLLSTQWIPLTFLYCERTLRERRFGFAILTGLFLALNFLSSWYYLYIVGSMFAIYLLIRLRPWKETLREGRVWLLLVVMVAVTSLLVVPVAWPTLTSSSGSMGWSLGDVEKWAASLDDFFLPNVYHPVWGERFLQMRSHTLRYPWYAPGFVYLGVVVLFFAFRGAFEKRDTDNVNGALFWIAFFSFLLALGVVVHWQNQVVGIKVSPEIETLYTRVMSTLTSKWAWHKSSLYDIDFRSGTVPIPLPGLLVNLFMPFGNSIRTFYRFGVITSFASIVLMGMGMAPYLGGMREPEPVTAPIGRHDVIGTGGYSRRTSFGVIALTAFLLALVVADFTSAPLPYGMTDVTVQPIDRWLAAQPEDTVVMQFPLVRALSGDTLYRTKHHGKLVTYGHGTFYPEPYLEAMPTLARFPSRECLDLLAEWGVTHVIVGSGAYDAGWGDQAGQTWEIMREQIEARNQDETGPKLNSIGVVVDEPIWRDETVSDIIVGNPPVEPILVDKLYVYELR